MISEGSCDKTRVMDAEINYILKMNYNVLSNLNKTII